MARLDAQSLFAAAARRNETNAVVASLVADLGNAVRAIAIGFGWKELTVAQLKLEAPEHGLIFERLLADVRTRAAELHGLDDVNKVRGNRALAWMRILIAGHTGGASAQVYDRRGAVAATPALSTASRTL